MTSKAIAGLAGVGIGLALVGGLAALAQDPERPKAAQDKAKAAPAKAPRGGMPDLVKGLKETPGCLGVETARTSSGKSVIFAWFADKKATIAWYNSRMHRTLMLGMGGGTHKPLENVPDDAGPILVIASITPSDKPKVEGFPLPISQVAIEMYQPLPGGAAFGGRFAPAGVKVPHLNDLDHQGGDEPAKADAAKPGP